MLTLRKRGRIYHVRGSVRVGQKLEIVKEHSTGCSSRAFAEAYRIKVEGEVQQRLLHGAAGRSGQLNVADAFKIYLERPEGHHAGDIVRIGTMNEHMGDIAIGSVIDGWNAFQRGRCGTLKPATVDRYRATLQAALNHAGAHWQMPVPRIPPIKFNNKIVRYLSEHERDNLLDAYATHVRPIMRTLCYQGCRTGEALRLEWPHVTNNRIYFAETKTGNPRSVLMHPRVAEAIGTLYRERGAPAAGRVFLNRLGTPYSDTRTYRHPGGNPLRKAHETACRRVGVTSFRVHDWRHHWASWCVMRGVDLLTIQKMGGWQSLRMVERYAAVSTEHMDEAMRKLG